MRYDAITVIEAEQHVRVPIVRRKRPAMAEHDGLPAAPILVENFGAVLGGNRRHCLSFLPSVESPTLLAELSHGLWASPVRTASARASMMPSMNSRFSIPHSQTQAIGSLTLSPFSLILYSFFVITCSYP